MNFPLDPTTMTPAQHRATAKRLLRDTEHLGKAYGENRRHYSEDGALRVIGEIANGYARANVHALLALEQPPTE